MGDFVGSMLIFLGALFGMMFMISKVLPGLVDAGAWTQTVSKNTELQEV